MRILLKLSGEMLEHGDASVSKTALEKIFSAIYPLPNDTQLCIVVGGGNFWRGRDTENLGLFRAKSDAIGMLATVMNALCLAEFLQQKGQKTAVFSATSMPRFCEEFSIDAAEKSFEEGKIIFFCGGTGNPYFTTDSASALRAIEMRCDFLAKATTVDGVYDSDPRKNPDAKKFEEISFDEVIIKNLGVMDTAAFALCRENSMPICVFNGSEPENIRKILRGEKVGTQVH